MPPLTKNIEIAVLPFECLTKGSVLDIYCRAFTYDLVAELSQFKQFQIRFTDPFHPESIEKVALADVDYLIKGYFSDFNEDIKLNVHLLEAKSDRIVWSYRNTNKITAIQEIQEALLGNLVALLQQQLDIDLLNNMRHKRPTHFKAYEYWLFGLHEIKKGTSESDMKARTYFEQAIAIDPGYSLAYSGMSLTYFNEWSCQIWDRWDLSQKGAKKWAKKALEVDPQNYLGNLILGKVLLFECSFDASEVYLRKALQLNPNDPFNLIQVASAFIYLNYLDEAETLYEKTLTLNPIMSENYHPIGAHIQFEKGNYQQSVDLGEKYLGMAWVDFPVIIAASYYYLGNVEKALELWQKYVNNYYVKISKNNENIELEALKWMIDVNPYKQRTAFAEFWKFVGQKQNYELSFPKANEKRAPGNMFERCGDLWKITYMGKVIHQRHSKGLNDIAALLANPGTELKCVELMGGGLTASSMEVTDKQTVVATRQRIEHIEEALACSIGLEDEESVYRLQKEYDDLIKYLSSVVDKRGRIRTSGTPVEKSRSAVTQRIKGALQKIEAAHPALHQHLTSSIKTGYFCSYKPQNATTWQT